MLRRRSWSRITAAQSVERQSIFGYVWCVDMSAVEDIPEDMPTSECYIVEGSQLMILVFQYFQLTLLTWLWKCNINV